MHNHFTIVRPALEDEVTQAQVARTHNIPASTIQRRVKCYREKGLSGLADARTCSDKGQSRRLPADAITLIEGLALQPPQRSMAAVHRQVVEVSAKQGWQPSSPGSPSFAQVLSCRTVYGTAPVAAIPARIEREAMALCATFS